jgi:hypothetical protein
MFLVSLVPVPLPDLSVDPTHGGFTPAPGSRSLGNILIVTTSCYETHDNYHPPRDRYHFVELSCTRDPLHPDVEVDEGQEVGQLLQFFIDSYGTLGHKKLIFTHNHDKCWHIGERTIWEHIDHLVKTDYFWTQPFGNIFRSYIIEVFFEPRPNNETFCQMDDDTWWMNMTDFAYFLFDNTSFMAMPWTNWNTPCCDMFFMDASLIVQHPREEYVLLRERLKTIARRGYCDMFDRQSCRDNASFIENTPRKRNFVAAGVFERAWGPMFTGKANQVWNLTATGTGR